MYQIDVFISHSWAYSTHYEKLCEWIFDGSWEVEGVPLLFNDRSVPKDDPIHYAPTTHALEHAILQRIEDSNIVVVPTGMYANYSKWIGKEINGAKRRDRPILGVNPWGQQRRSTVVAKAAAKTVGWKKQSVVGGIWELSNASSNLTH